MNSGLIPVKLNLTGLDLIQRTVESRSDGSRVIQTLRDTEINHVWKPDLKSSEELQNDLKQA